MILRKETRKKTEGWQLCNNCNLFTHPLHTYTWSYWDTEILFIILKNFLYRILEFQITFFTIY